MRQEFARRLRHTFQDSITNRKSPYDSEMRLLRLQLDSFPLWAQLAKKLIKLPTVVWMNQMAEFMDDDIVDANAGCSD